MNIILCAIGRSRLSPEKVLFDHYLKRIRWSFKTHEIIEKRKLPKKNLLRNEGKQILEKIPQCAPIILLDEKGDNLSSFEFSNKLCGWNALGCRDIAFVIGGKAGVDPEIFKKANLILSFGKVTWPHMLVRVLLAEQVYRAQSISEGHPYHEI